MKKIFIVSRAKNESDIIESFCRYNLTYCDGMFIQDNGSSDNTLEILQKLIDEGLPIFLTQNCSNLDRANKAIDEYGADLIIPLDTDEFLYHIDGINPRDTLEAMHEDVEYQAIWRTYIYEKEPDINLGFMPNNFLCYRNPEMENPDIYSRHKKAIASKYLLRNKNAYFISGSHFLVYPDNFKDSIKTEIHPKLVFAHFPIRSKNQVLKKGIINWITKWGQENRVPHNILDNFQLGMIFNEIKNNLNLSYEILKQFSIEYAMFLDNNILGKEYFNEIKNKLCNNLLVSGPFSTSSISNELKLHYTSFNYDNNFLKDIIMEIDKTVTFLDNESNERFKIIYDLTQERNLLSSERLTLINEHDNLIKESEKHISEYNNLSNKYNKQISEYNNLSSDYTRLKNDSFNEITSIKNSRSWRITKPLRKISSFTKKYFNLSNSFKNKDIAEYFHLYNNFKIDNIEREKQKNKIFKNQVLVSIITPLYNTPIDYLNELIDSVKNQTYNNWEMCFSDASDSKYSYIKKICKETEKKDKRFKYIKINKNEGIAENTIYAYNLSIGDYIILLDHDDLLAENTLYEVVKEINLNPDTDFIFSDRLVFNNKTKKIIGQQNLPGYSPDLLRSFNYACHLSVFSRNIIKKVGFLRSGYNGSQDYEFELRVIECAKNIIHIDKILYFCRAGESSVAENPRNKMYAYENGKKALEEHINRIGYPGKVEFVENTFSYRIHYDINKNDIVSIIILNKDNIEILSRCIDSIIIKTTYQKYEIIIIENNSILPETFSYYENIKNKYNNILSIKVYENSNEFNFSLLNNWSIQYAKGDYLLFLNNDTQVITPNWIEEMVMFAQRNDVGAVGVKLYYPDNTIQHNGLIIGLDGSCASSYDYGVPKNSSGYMNCLNMARNYSAVTAACMMIKRKDFIAVNGFDEDNFKVGLNDVDICLKLREKNKLIVFTPYAELYHFEGATRGNDINDISNYPRFQNEQNIFKDKWKKYFMDKDPYFYRNIY